MKKLKAIILCGGLGTRLQPLTFSIPKPLLPVGEKPILEVILTRLKGFGFREFILSVGYRAELIQTYFGDGSQFGVKIVYVREDKPLGTAGSLALVYKKIKFDEGESILLMNGDILTKLNIKNFVEYHRKNGFLITVGIKKYDQRLPFGVIEIQDNRIVGIVEKPSKKYNISAGLYLLKSSVLKEIPYNRFFTIPDLINKIISQNKKVGGYLIKEYWLAIEQIHHIEKARHEIKKWF